MMAGIGPDQLRGDAQATARFAHAAFEYITHAQFLADLFDVDWFALVINGRCARDDREGAPASEQCDDVLGDAVSEEFLLRVAAEIGEWQYRDRAAIAHRHGGVHSGGIFGHDALVAAHAVDADRSADVL